MTIVTPKMDANIILLFAMITTYVLVTYVVKTMVATSLQSAAMITMLVLLILVILTLVVLTSRSPAMTVMNALLIVAIVKMGANTSLLILKKTHLAPNGLLTNVNPTLTVKMITPVLKTTVMNLSVTPKLLIAMIKILVPSTLAILYMVV
jgi:hypothetical protein